MKKLLYFAVMATAFYSCKKEIDANNQSSPPSQSNDETILTPKTWQFFNGTWRDYVGATTPGSDFYCDISSPTNCKEVPGSALNNVNVQSVLDLIVQYNLGNASFGEVQTNFAMYYNDLENTGTMNESTIQKVIDGTLYPVIPHPNTYTNEAYRYVTFWEFNFGVLTVAEKVYFN